MKILFEETAFLTLFNLAVNEANTTIFKHCGVFFVHEILDLNIILKIAADRYRAHIARTNLVTI